MTTNGPTAKTYPTEEQYERWKEAADEQDMSVSRWIAGMVEAGRKKFEVEVEPDRPAAKVRRQRDDMRQQLAEARDRIEQLETSLHDTERDVIEQFVAENPGATWDEITQHVAETAGSRVTNHLEAMTGESIRRGAADGFYPREDHE